MSIFKRVTSLVFIGLIFIGLNTPVKADELLGDIKIPEVNPPKWAVGQSSTYKLTLEGIPEFKDDLFSVDINMAIVGQETINGKNMHWFEVDLGNMKGLPHDAGMFESLKVKILMPQLKPEKYNGDRIELMKDFARGDIIQKIVFQIDNQTPQYIDYATLSGLIQGLSGESMDSIIDEIDVEEINQDMPPGAIVKTGKETISVPAGKFSNSLYTLFELKEENEWGKLKVHGHDDVPITGLLKVIFNIHDMGEDIQIQMELVDYRMKGARSRITGEPIPFNLSEIMGMD